MALSNRMERTCSKLLTEDSFLIRLVLRRLEPAPNEKVRTQTQVGEVLTLESNVPIKYRNFLTNFINFLFPIIMHWIII